MTEIDLVFGCVARELDFAVGCGRAGEFGRAIGEAIAEQLATTRELSRDQLAAMAMQGLVSDGGKAWIERLGETAYAIADVVLAERAKRKP